MLRKGTVLLLCARLSCILSYPTGPPLTVCSSLTPDHPDGELVTTSNGGFIITTSIPFNADNTGYDYQADQIYTVTLAGRNSTFRGFAIQSRSVPESTPVGFFTPQNSNQQILNCDPDLNFTVVHSNPTPRMDFNSQEFLWTSPNSSGIVDFKYTVVEANPGNFYVARSAIEEFIVSESKVETTTSAGVTTTLHEEHTMTTGIPQGVTMPSSSATDYPLVYKSPFNCDLSDCKVYVGIERNQGNPDYLNFYIEGDAAAWVAMGFSPTPSMPDADILACNRIHGGEEVEILDAWSPGYTTVVDQVMDTFVFTSSVQDGRIFCSFGRSISGSGDEQDFDLDGDYYVQYGHSDGTTSSHALLSHRTSSPPTNPTFSGDRLNVAEVSVPPTESTGTQTGVKTVPALVMTCLISYLLH